VETETRIAECLLFGGEAGGTVLAVEEALERAKTLGGVAPQAPLLFRLRGYALMQLGRLEEAEDALWVSLESARSREADYEVAMSLQALMRLDRLRGRAPQAAVETEHRDIVERLGIVAEPLIPLGHSGPTPT